MRYLSPFRPRGSITPFSGGSFANLEKEFESLFGSLPSLFDVGGDWIADSGSRSARPNWYENEDSYVARIELPGVDPKEISIEVGDNMVKLAAERKSKSDKGETAISYSQTFSIPDGVEADKASAAVDEGVLSVTFPKAEVLKPRKIEVN